MLILLVKMVNLWNSNYARIQEYEIKVNKIKFEFLKVNDLYKNIFYIQ